MNDMVEVKTTELIGPALDWAVAKAEGLPLCSEACQGDYIVVGTGAGDLQRYSPSMNWAHGGPLIGKHNVSVCHRGDYWTAAIGRMNDKVVKADELPLIAACLAIVASITGDVLMVPAELLETTGQADPL